MYGKIIVGNGGEFFYGNLYLEIKKKCNFYKTTFILEQIPFPLEIELIPDSLPRMASLDSHSHLE